jgi:hypothetical protein
LVVLLRYKNFGFYIFFTGTRVGGEGGGNGNGNKRNVDILEYLVEKWTLIKY